MRSLRLCAASLRLGTELSLGAVAVGHPGHGEAPGLPSWEEPLWADLICLRRKPGSTTTGAWHSQGLNGKSSILKIIAHHGWGVLVCIWQFGQTKKMIWGGGNQSYPHHLVSRVLTSLVCIQTTTWKSRLCNFTGAIWEAGPEQGPMRMARYKSHPGGEGRWKGWFEKAEGKKHAERWKERSFVNSSEEN